MEMDLESRLRRTIERSAELRRQTEKLREQTQKLAQECIELRKTSEKDSGRGSRPTRRWTI